MDLSRKVSHQPHKRRKARRGGQRMNRRSREVGFIFIVAIRRETRRRASSDREGGKDRRRWDNRVAVVIINDATSNATSVFSPPPFLSSCLLPSPLRSLFHRFLLPLTRHCCLVSFLRRFVFPHSFRDHV